MWSREHVLTGRGLARRPLSARRACDKMTSSATCQSFRRLLHVVQYIFISHTAQTEMCANFKSERRGTKNILQCSQSERSCTEDLFREHFPGYVYREHIWTGPNNHKHVKYPHYVRQTIHVPDLYHVPASWLLFKCQVDKMRATMLKPLRSAMAFEVHALCESWMSAINSKHTACQF